MRRESTKAAKSRRIHSKARAEYRQQLCQVCLFLAASEVHEIARGIARAEAYGERATWLAVCRPCHDYLGDYSIWPLERQLAVKLVRDAEHFDLDIFNRVRGRAPGAIAMEDVVCHLQLKGKP